MSQIQIFQPFLTTLTCLCASSYGPNITPALNLTHNFEKEILSWNTELIEVIEKSSLDFQLKNIENNCLVNTFGDNVQRTRESGELLVRKKREKICDCDQAEEEIEEYKKELKEIKAKFVGLVLYTNHTELALNQTKKELESANRIILDLQNEIKDKKRLIEKLEKYNEDQEVELGKLKSMAPPTLNNLTNNCLIASQGGVANLELKFSEDFYCARDQLDAGFGTDWLLVAQRFDGSQNFNRTWDEYANGFGAYGSKHEFFAGLERIFALTKNSTQQLLIVFEDSEKRKRHAKYENFSLGSNKQFFKLESLGEFNGDAGDSLSAHLSQKFATYDKDNELNCAKAQGGGWWYAADNCLKSNLFGYIDQSETSMIKGIFWPTLLEDEDFGEIKAMRLYLRPISDTLLLELHLA